MPQLDSISEKEFEEWLLHPITREFRRVLGVKRRELRDLWEDGHFTGDKIEETVIRNVSNMGLAQGYKYGETMNYLTFNEDRKDEE